MPRCDFCFRDKAQIMPFMPKCIAKICKACSYDIDKVVGFLEHYGIRLLAQGELPLIPPTPRKKRPQKAQDVKMGEKSKTSRNTLGESQKST